MMSLLIKKHNKEEFMSRIKFLDILEETKTKPLHSGSSSQGYQSDFSTRGVARDFQESEQEFAPRRRERTEPAENKLSSLRERSLLRDSGVSYESREPRTTIKQHASSPKINTISKDDSKVLLTGALFVLFGGMLFLSGYWVGKTITSNVKSDNEVLMAQSFNDFKKSEQFSDVAATTMPMASTVDTIAPMKVIEPVPTVPTPAKTTTPKPAAPKPTPTPSQEYIIQISAHSTMESARLVEDQLRASGFSAYTSESVIGDSVFFRVRLRGFNSKKSAEDTLTQIKARGVGQDGFVLTLE